MNQAQNEWLKKTKHGERRSKKVASTILNFTTDPTIAAVMYKSAAAWQQFLQARQKVTIATHYHQKHNNTQKIMPIKLHFHLKQKIKFVL
tara:strand:+ start:649 stop:918 length:270 start_codon:yes stop_codon:yes gene_type:complete